MADRTGMGLVERVVAVFFKKALQPYAVRLFSFVPGMQ